MKKILFALCVVLALVGCKKTTEEQGSGGTTGTLAFNNGTDGTVTMSCGSSQVISITGAKLTECTFTSSNPEVVSIDNEDLSLYAASEGEATVTATLKSDASKTATLKVIVTAMYNNLHFDVVHMYYVVLDDGSYAPDYEIFRVRYYRGDELTDGGDAQLTEVDLTATFDTAATSDDWQNCVDNFERGNWYHIYDKVTEDGETLKMGMFCDSVMSLMDRVFPPEVYYDGNDELAMTEEESGWLVLYDNIYYDVKYTFSLGGRTIVDDIYAAGKQYVQTGSEAVPYPGYVQQGHFDSEAYCEAYTYALSGTTFEWSDYPYYQDNDCYLTYLFYYTDSESGESSIGGTELGYLNPAATAEADNFYLYVRTGDSGQEIYMQAYDFTATIFKNYANYGFALTTNEEGELIFDTDEEGYLKMGPTEEVSYYYEDSSAAPRRIKGNQKNHRELPMSRKGMARQISVNQTIGAALNVFFKMHNK